MKSAVSFGNFAETERFEGVSEAKRKVFSKKCEHFRTFPNQCLQKEQTKLCLIIHRKNIVRCCVVFTSEMCKKRTDSEDFTRGDSMET